jgi:hypothetical protein
MRAEKRKCLISGISTKLPHNQEITNAFFVLVFSNPARTLRLNFPNSCRNCILSSNGAWCA